MKKMNNLIALAVAAAVMSPMAALADNTPDNVGNVTLLGNIVANSPMWQWTVNDYPGPRLDAKPSEAVTANGVTTYKLNGQKFIAVSGYIPSMTGMVGPASTVVGFADKTEFTDGDGTVIGGILNDSSPMAVRFTVKAHSTDTEGNSVTGTLLLRATEMRGTKVAYSPAARNHVRVLATVSGATNAHRVAGGSCFVGTNRTAPIFGGNAENPTITGPSATAVAAYLEAFNAADATGAVRFADTPAPGNGAGGSDYTRAWTANCQDDTPSYAKLVNPATGATWNYIASAHIVELTPMEVAFTTPVQGNWNATLNVTAYQM